MSHHFISRFLLFHIRSPTLLISTTNNILQLRFLQNPSSLTKARFISTSKPSFTLDYLINSCGLSPDSALKASKKIVLKSTTKPDSVLLLFKSYGFTQPRISKIISRRPDVLSVNPQKILKPKLEFFVKLGISGPGLGKLFSGSPSILLTSLHRQIIPCVKFLKTIVHTDKNVVALLSRSRWGLHDAEHRMTPNIAILRDHGVSESSITWFTTKQPQNLLRNVDSFEEVVLQVEKMGFNALSKMFIHAIHLLVGMKKSVWNEKVGVYTSFGWSEDEVVSAFKKQPNIMGISKEKLASSLDFFMNNLKWTKHDIAKNGTVLALSFEKRVIPRCRVLQILRSKDLMSKDGMGQALRVAEDVFLKKYVIMHLSELPDLLKVYQGKMDAQALIVASEDRSKVDKLLNV